LHQAQVWNLNTLRKNLFVNFFPLIWLSSSFEDDNAYSGFILEGWSVCKVHLTVDSTLQICKQSSWYIAAQLFAKPLLFVILYFRPIVSYLRSKFSLSLSLSLFSS
jgi:hypothetical protein